MSRPPRLVWLLDSTEPTGPTTVAMRRRALLADRTADHVFVLDTAGPAGPRPPVGSPLRDAAKLAGLDAEVALARADVVVSTTPRTLVSASARSTGRSRHVHMLGTRWPDALAEERVARGMPRVDWLVVPPGTPISRVARLAGLPADRVRALPEPGPADGVVARDGSTRVVLAVGRAGDPDRPEYLDRSTALAGLLDLIDGFVRADLPGWQLRLAGGGPGVSRLVDRVEQLRAGHRVFVLGPRHDLPALVADAGVLARVVGPEAYGLPVLDALAAGVPVLATADCPAAVAHVRDDENGRLLHRTDPASLAAAFTDLADDGLRARLAAGARASAVVTGPADRRDLDELLDDVLARRPRVAAGAVE